MLYPRLVIFWDHLVSLALRRRQVIPRGCGGLQPPYNQQAHLLFSKPELGGGGHLEASEQVYKLLCNHRIAIFESGKLWPFKISRTSRSLL